MEPLLIRGTTPIVRFQFNKVQVSSLTTAKLVIKQNGTNKIVKDIDSATIDTDGNYIDWVLTQAESLTLTNDSCAVALCDWLITSGVRGRSSALRLRIGDPGINEVITDD